MGACGWAGSGVRAARLLSTRVSLGSDIIVFNWKDAGDGRRELDMDASHAGNVVALYLKTRGNLVLVGDLMRSVQLLDYGSLNQEHAGERTRFALRAAPRAVAALPASALQLRRLPTTRPQRITALEMFDDDTYIAAENSYNLLLFKKQRSAPVGCGAPNAAGLTLALPCLPQRGAEARARAAGWPAGGVRVHG